MPKRHKSMSEFAHSTLSLTEFLEEDPDLDIVEQIFIENHIYVVRSAYGAWKRRHPSERNHTGESSKKRSS